MMRIFSFCCLLIFIGCNTVSTDKEVDAVYNQAHSCLLNAHYEDGFRIMDANYKSKQFTGDYAFLKWHEFMIYFNYETNRKHIGKLHADTIISYILKHNLEKKYPQSNAMAYGTIGNYYYYEEPDFDKAFDNLYKAREISKDGNDTCAATSMSTSIGHICYHQGKFKDAIKNYQQSYDFGKYCAENMFKTFGEQEQMDNIALCFTKLKEYDSAAKYYLHALKIIDENEQKIKRAKWKQARGVIYGNFAKVFIAQGKYDSATVLLQKSIDINSKPGMENNDAEYSMMQLAELKWMQHQSPEVLLNELKLRLDTLPNSDVLLRWNSLMYDFKKATNHPEEALVFLKNYYSLKDSFEATSKVKKIDVAQMLKYQKAESEIELLTKDNELRKLYFGLAAGFSILVLVIIVLVFVNYRKSKKNAEKIKEQNKNLAQAKSSLEQTNKEKDRILNVVAHDLRSPMGAISYISELSLMNDENPEKTQSALEKIKTTSQNTLLLINELIGIHEHHKNEERKTVDLIALIKECESLLHFRAEVKQQTIRISHTENTICILGHQERLNRLFTNLITNAIKFSPVKGTISIDLIKNEKEVSICIQDNGIGIPATQQKEVFEIFTSAKRSGTSGEQSFGLGLYICKQITEEHHGTISLKSEEGKGTTFTLKFPTK